MSESKYVAFAQPRIELGTRAEARNSEITRCLKMNPKYIFMIDTDQTMPVEGFTALISRMMAHDADIAVIDTPPAKLDPATGTTEGSDRQNIQYNPDGTIAYCSIACAMFRADIFHQLPQPWFDSSYDYQLVDSKGGKLVFDKLLKSNNNNVGEDIFFVRNALEAGLRFEYVTKVRCAHFKL